MFENLALASLELFRDDKKISEKLQNKGEFSYKKEYPPGQTSEAESDISENERVVNEEDSSPEYEKEGPQRRRETPEKQGFEYDPELTCIENLILKLLYYLPSSWLSEDRKQSLVYLPCSGSSGPPEPSTSPSKPLTEPRLPLSAQISQRAHSQHQRATARGTAASARGAMQIAKSRMRRSRWWRVRMTAASVFVLLALLLLLLLLLCGLHLLFTSLLSSSVSNRPPLHTGAVAAAVDSSQSAEPADQQSAQFGSNRDVQNPCGPKADCSSGRPLLSHRFPFGPPPL